MSSSTLPSPARAAAVSGGQPAAVPAQFLTFLLGERTFGVGIDAVVEIVRVGPVTPMPRTPPQIRGIVNLRGAVLPVLDLNVYVGQAATPLTPQSCIVVTRLPQAGAAAPLMLGLLVDCVVAVLSPDPHDVEPAPPFGAGLRTQLLLGVLRQGERFIMLLDTARALSLSELGQEIWQGQLARSVAAELAAPGHPAAANRVAGADPNGSVNAAANAAATGTVDMSAAAPSRATVAGTV